MSSSKSIVIFGRDFGLLETRRLVLQHAGFEVCTLTTLEELEKTLTVGQTIDLLVICHSLPSEECERALALVRSHLAGKKNLVLNAGAPLGPLSQEEVVLSSFDGPKILIATIQSLLEFNRGKAAGA